MPTPNTAATIAPAPIEHPYLLDSIAQAPSPLNPEESDWHRYVITQGENRIVGYRRGPAQSVRQEVVEIVTQLNARRTIKPGRTHLTIGPSSKAKA